MTSPSLFAADKPAPRLRTGGQLLVEQLLAFGATHAFMVPGESFLPCIDALHDVADRIRTIVCRHESGVTYMAEAHAKLTGRPGIAFVSRGPGASNAMIGVHTAQQDSTPLILFIGQVGGDTSDRECFQEIDYRRLFSPVCKWVAQIERAERIPEYLARAHAIATSGRPGPVVLALPEDMLAQTTDAPLAPLPSPAAGSPGAAQMEQLREMIEAARHPLLLLGGSGWDEDSRKVMHAFAERFGLAVATAWRRLGLFDNDHPHFVGQVSASMPAHQKARVLESDLVLAVGTRLCEPTTLNYQWLESPQPRQRLIHVHPDANEIGRLCVPALGIVASVRDFAASCASLMPSENAPRREVRPCVDPGIPPMAGPLDLNACGRHVAATLPQRSCVTVGAGNYALYAHRHIRFRGLGSQLSPALGAMGYGLPAAIAAKLHDPESQVVCFAGDGCFQMTQQELATAVQYNLGIVVLVFNNGLYGTIRLHQERAFPGRPMATALVNPDFAALARSYGIFGQTVEHTEAFAPAYAEALAFARERKLPALIELRYSAEQILPDQTLTDVRG